VRSISDGSRRRSAPRPKRRVEAPTPRTLESRRETHPADVLKDDLDEEAIDEAQRRMRKKTRRIRPEAKRELSWIWKVPPKAGTSVATGGREDEEVVASEEEMGDG
jgi:hypothetical protein